MKANIPETGKKRIVIVGGGFGGLKLAHSFLAMDLQVVLLDKNNYHLFPPLLYQVGTAGLEPSTICFPFRKVFQKKKNIIIRITEVSRVDIAGSFVETDSGTIHYDYLVIATGTDTNYFGNENIKRHAMPMKSVSEALSLRNTILQKYEDALSVRSEERQGYMNVVVVGGGPTGVELSGALAEMKKYILPKDYPELDFSEMNIHLVEASPRTLNGMSVEAGEKSKMFLEKLGVRLHMGMSVKDYDGEYAYLQDGGKIPSRILIWAAGVTGNKINGIPEENIGKGNRIKVDRFNRMLGSENIFAIGDVALMTEDRYPHGHPQVAQVAIQQGARLSKNFKNIFSGKPLEEFTYKDLGSMATVGRNLAVADLPRIKFQGFFAWLIWMFVHLMSIVGIKNKLFILIDWAWSYITYDQSLRLIIKPGKIVRKKN